MSLNKCYKIFYSLLDITLGCTSIATIILIVYSFIWIHKYDLFINISFYLPVGILFFAQLFTLLIFWVGCKGILTENLFIINTLCALLAIKIILEIGTGVWIFMLRDQVNEVTFEYMENSFKNYTINNYKKQEWNNIQYQLHCCGINGPISFAEHKVDFIPKSCCNITSENDITCEGGFYQIGCHKALTEHVVQTYLLLAQVVFLYVTIQIIGLVLFANLKALLVKTGTTKNREEKLLQVKTNKEKNPFS